MQFFGQQHTRDPLPTSALTICLRGLARRTASLLFFFESLTHYLGTCLKQFGWCGHDNDFFGRGVAPCRVVGNHCFCHLRLPFRSSQAPGNFLKYRPKRRPSETPPMIPNDRYNQQGLPDNQICQAARGMHLCLANQRQQNQGGCAGCLADWRGIVSAPPALTDSSAASFPCRNKNPDGETNHCRKSCEIYPRLSSRHFRPRWPTRLNC